MHVYERSLLITTYTKRDNRLWHNRLGHLGLNGMRELKRMDLINRTFDSNVPFCESYVMGKQSK